jgi:CelD/BcsL family acetyltransferase involved in cellulose biosynthesis
LRFEAFKTPEEMRVFLADTAPLAVKTYQARLFDGALPTSSSFEESVARASEHDGVRAYLLRHGQKPIAYAYCTIDAERERLTYQIVGYDPSYKAFSPGTVLLYLILQQQFDCPDAAYFDFGSGESFYKRFFSTGTVDCVELYYFPLSVKPILMIGLLEALDATSSLATRAVEQLELKEKLKKLLRRGLRES